VIEETILFKL